MKFTTEQRAAVHAAIDRMLDKDEAGEVDELPSPDEIRSVSAAFLLGMVARANASAIDVSDEDDAAACLLAIGYNNLVMSQILRGEL